MQYWLYLFNWTLKLPQNALDNIPLMCIFHLTHRYEPHCINSPHFASLSASIHLKRLSSRYWKKMDSRICSCSSLRASVWSVWKCMSTRPECRISIVYLHWHWRFYPGHSSSRHVLLSLAISDTLLSEKWPSSCTGWHSITDLSVAFAAEWVSVLENPPLLCSPFDCLFMMCPRVPVGRETNAASWRTDYAWS